MHKHTWIFIVLASLFGGIVVTTPAAGGSGLAGWWKLDETSGTTASDASGNGNDGTLQGNGQWVEGTLDGAWQGDGDGDYIRIPHSDSLNLSDAVTVALWLYGGIAPDQVLCKGTGGDAWVSSYSIRVDDDSSHARQINWRGRVGSATNGLNSATALPTAEWVHVAVTFDVAASDNNQKIYINGVLDAENRSTNALSTNTNDLLLGADAYDTTRWHWQGKLDDVRIYNRALTAGEIPDVMAGRTGGYAFAPSPEEEATDVPCDTAMSWTGAETAVTRDVYLGTSFDDVNDAGRDNPMGVLVSQDQTDTTYTLDAPLEYGQTYYWRIDEVNGAPDYTLFKGEVWSFTTETYGYPITSLTVEASGQQATSPAIRTIDRSGLDEFDQHGVDLKQMWVTPGGLPAWIQYTFDKEYKLHELWVWNANSELETLMGFGAKDVTIEYSTDGTTWAQLENVPEFAQGTGKATYTANTVVDLGEVMARYVKLTINDNWGATTMVSLSEVRFFYTPAQAFEPVPADGAAEIGLDTELTWRPGREATSHTVHFGADANAMDARTVTDHSYTPPTLDFGTVYYWKVDEVGDAGTYAGELWSFTSQEFALIEDFESYTDDIDAEATIWHAWIDGVTTKASGSQVGYTDSPFAETKIVHGGKQSMPLAYDNATSFFFSEAEREFESAQNWTGNGATDVSLWVRGYPALASVTVTETSGKIDVTGAGADVWDNSDEFTYAYKTLTGDGTLVARVVSNGTGSSTWTKGGVMIRDSLRGGSTHAFMAMTATGGNGASFQYRAATDGGSANNDSVAVIAPPYWVKIERSADMLTGYLSADGKTWSTVGTAVVTMADPVCIGLAVTSHEAGVDRTFQFDSIAATGAVTGAWQGVVIGNAEYNAAANMHLLVEDSAGKSATATNATIVTAADWTRWTIPMSDFPGVNFAKVKKMAITIGDKTATTAGGTGLVFIDDIGFGHAAE
ncbi:MAG: LamG-like jellyroll fold domain-containing protein [Phycisphaerales bacterium]